MDLGLHYRAINLNDHLKDSWQGIVSPSIYRRTYLETDRKGGDSERAGPCAHMWQLRSWRDISWAKVPPEECRVLLSLLDPTPRTCGPRIGSCIWQWKSVVSLSAGKRWESTRMPGALLNNQCKGASSRALTWGSNRGKLTQGMWKLWREHLGGVAPKREWTTNVPIASKTQLQ